jgi:hypothetical protein
VILGRLVYRMGQSHAVHGFAKSQQAFFNPFRFRPSDPIPDPLPLLALDAGCLEPANRWCGTIESGTVAIHSGSRQGAQANS